MNSAFVFVKPHAVTDSVTSLVKTTLESKGIKFLQEGVLKGEVIDERKLIDQHYYAIASKATLLKPHELNVPADKFEAEFGISWQDALQSGKVFNALDACKHLGVDAETLNEEFQKGKKVKFGGGFYCGFMKTEGKEPVYVFNGFFMRMRAKFTAPGSELHYFVVEWDSSVLSWEDFRGKVLGPTDPTTAPADSLRGKVFADWKELGLKSIPNVSDNGVHASASPFEGLAERQNWLSAQIEDDMFGKQLLEAGVSKDLIVKWSVDPQVDIGDGKKGSLFDQVEDMDSAACISKLVELSNLGLDDAQGTKRKAENA